jgi:hypothetical protein
MATSRSSLDPFRAPGPGRVTARLRVALPGPAAARSGRHLRTVLFRYMAAAVVLLALVLLIDPHDPERATPGQQPWRYQRDAVEVEGKGVLNLVARSSIRTTAWMARGSIDRLRDVSRLNLLDLLVGTPTATKVGGWRETNGLALERTTKLAMVLLVGIGVVAKVRGRGWIVMILVLLALTLLLTKPQTTVRLASAPGLQVPNAMVELYGQLDPARSADGSLPADQTEQALAGDYWQSFVGNPLSRMQTGTPVLTGAEPERRAGLLDGLRHGLTGVNDWAVGKHGWERAFISTTAVAYVVPFSIVIAALAMVATAAQAVLFLLCLAALVVIPVAVERRHRPACFRYWLLPLLGTVAVLAVSSFAALLAMRLGQAVHATDEYVGLLLAGSIWPISAVIALRLLARRRRRAIPSNGGTAE